MIYEKNFNKFVSCFHGIEVMFRNAHVTVKYAPFKSHCMDLYGSWFWVLGSSKVDKFYTI